MQEAKIESNDVQNIPVEIQEQKFNNLYVVERLDLPKDNRDYIIKLHSELCLMKNYELVDKLGVGIYKLDYWKEIISNSDKKDNFFLMFRINSRPLFLRTVRTDKAITYYDKHLGVNLEFNVYYNYSYKISDSMDFIKNIVGFKNKYEFNVLYKYIENEINISLLSFISEYMTKVDSSIIKFNTNSKDLSADFNQYAKENMFINNGIELLDFNFMRLDFSKDKTYDEINKTLYEKADMKLRDYTYQDKSKYDILKKMSNVNIDNVIVEKDEE